MALWPFRKRAKTNSGEKIGVAPQKTGNGRLMKDKQQERSQPPIVDAPAVHLITNTNIPHEQIVVGATFMPQKQYHQSGYSSYFLEHSNTNEDTSDNSQLPHKPNMSTRFRKKASKDQAKAGEKSYITPPTSGAEDAPSSDVHQSKFRFGRSSAKRDRGKAKSDGMAKERNPSLTRDSSQAPIRGSVNSSLSSHNSIKPLKPELKGFEILIPRPKLHFGHDSRQSPAPYKPSRADSRRSRNANLETVGKFRNIPQALLGASSTIDGLADDMDAKDLREAMDRDRRRRERRKIAEHERIQRKMEIRLMKQKAAQQEIHDDSEQDMDEGFFAGPSNSRPNINKKWATAPLSAGAQTPVSWLRDPSVEDLTNIAPFASRKSSPTRGNHSQHAIGELTNSEYRTSTEIPTEAAQYPVHKEEAQVNVSQPTNEGGEGNGRARWTSFLKKATASRIRKEQASREFNIGESTLVSDSEGELEEAPKRRFEPNFEEFGQSPLHRDAVPVGVLNGINGSQNEQPFYPDDGYELPDTSPPQGEQIIGLAVSPIDSARPEPHMGSLPYPRQTPLASQPTTRYRQPPSPQVTYHSRPNSRNTASRASRYSSRAVSPDAPSAGITQSLASIDSEASWLSGKASRQSYTHATPLRTSATSLRNRYREFESDEENGGGADADDYFGRVSRLNHVNPFMEEEEENHRDYTRQHPKEETMLNLSDDEGSEGDIPEANLNQTQWRDGAAKSPQIHDMPWRAKSREGHLRFDDDEPPSPTVATIGDYGSSTNTPGIYGTPLEHPFAQVGENFVTPLEHFSERRPRYKGSSS